MHVCHTSGSRCSPTCFRREALSRLVVQDTMHILLHVDRRTPHPSRSSGGAHDATAWVSDGRRRILGRARQPKHAAMEDLYRESSDAVSTRQRGSVCLLESAHGKSRRARKSGRMFDYESKGVKRLGTRADRTQETRPRHRHATNETFSNQTAMVVGHETVPFGRSNQNKPKARNSASCWPLCFSFLALPNGCRPLAKANITEPDNSKFRFRHLWHPDATHSNRRCMM